LVETTSLFLLEFRFGCDVAEELAVATVLHYNEESSRRLYDLVHLNDVRMANNFEDVEFSTHSFNVGDFGDLVFLKNFDCDLLLCEKMDSLLNFTESALA